jgi:hypothetical protein
MTPRIIATCCSPSGTVPLRCETWCARTTEYRSTRCSRSGNSRMPMIVGFTYATSTSRAAIRRSCATKLSPAVAIAASMIRPSRMPRDVNASAWITSRSLGRASQTALIILPAERSQFNSVWSDIMTAALSDRRPSRRDTAAAHSARQRGVSSLNSCCAAAGSPSAPARISQGARRGENGAMRMSAVPIDEAGWLNFVVGIALSVS